MHDEKGREIPDQTPVALPIGWKAPPTLHEQIQRYIRNEVSRQAAEAGSESFEEADDFYVEDDPDMNSPYEIDDGLAPWDEKSAQKEALEHAEAEVVKKLKPPSQGQQKAPAAGASGSSPGGGGAEASRQG